MYAALRIQKTALGAFIGGVKHCEKKSSTCETGVSLHRIALELP